MQKEYRSVEQKIEMPLSPIVKGTSEFIDHGIRGFYVAVTSIFRIPTAIRKCNNEQELAGISDEINNRKQIYYRLAGFITGVLTGSASDYLLALYVLKGIVYDNYTPLEILAATNLASGIFELRRLSKSRQEHQELIEGITEEKEAEKEA